MKMSTLYRKSAQSVVEYVLIMCVVLAAILSVGFVDKMRGAFGKYFTKAAETITIIK